MLIEWLDAAENKSRMCLFLLLLLALIGQLHCITHDVHEIVSICMLNSECIIFNWAQLKRTCLYPNVLACGWCVAVVWYFVEFKMGRFISNNTNGNGFTVENSSVSHTLDSRRPRQSATVHFHLPYNVCPGPPYDHSSKC